MSSGPVLRVAINAPLSRLFDYLPPPGVMPPVGSRVRVPFGRRVQVGMVMTIADTTDVPVARLREAIEILDEKPLLYAADLWLINFTSSYYHHPIGEVVAAALPGLLRKGNPLISAVRMISITAAGNDADTDELGRRAPRQAELLALIKDVQSIRFAELDEVMPGWRRVKKTLLEKSYIDELEIHDDGRDGQAFSNVEQVAAPRLNADQSAALRHIRQETGFHVSLIDGVTGSGKTEIYLRLIQDEIDAGRQVLVLVPEIGLTPQLVVRFRERLGIEPVLMHSALTDNERLANWREARNGSAQLIVGTRSAVFVPLKNPGLIIVDEEHDGSLKQQEGLRYSARDLSIARAKNRNLPVVLGTATPSLESLLRCEEGAYQRLLLPTRAGEAVAPLLRLVDLTRQPSANGLSDPVVNAIRSNTEQGGQALIFLNRRGFAPTLICAGCGLVAECSRCDARMTVHSGSNRLMCHHCGSIRAIESECQECGSPCRPLGHGTERLEESLRSIFPDQPISRIDSDSTRLKGTMSKALAMATSGETKILVGTQMLSKGHHFPNLTLVVVINADQGLFSTDFRGGERLAQSLVQVAGRAGREKRQGEVIIQTAFPAHPFWGELFSGGYEKVAQTALQERRSAAWPPFARLALLRAAGTKRDETHHFLSAARVIAENMQIADVRILGPVSAPMERRAGRYRAQLLLQSRDRRSLHEMLQQLRGTLENDAASRRVRWSIDVDPIELF
ncbi:MAG: primosomal protein N' (replication factor Y) [Woeseiaceae bacterium]|jgi:primosomal protein N' (replication factor Y)